MVNNRRVDWQCQAGYAFLLATALQRSGTDSDQGRNTPTCSRVSAFLPWSQAVLNNPKAFEKCLLAVYPDRNGRWRVQSLPVSRALRFSNRLTAPAAWRGLQGEELDAATGLHNMNFVHRAGFTGGASTFEDDMQLAQLWLKQGERFQG